MNLTTKFIKAMSSLSENEGGWGNDPNDSGGETYEGISHVYNPTWIGWAIIDRMKKLPDFPNNLQNSKELQELVLKFYNATYWLPLKCEEIEDFDVAFSIFDFAVNAGAGTCAKIAQKVVGVEDDGIIGKETLRAINSYSPKCFLAEFKLAKIDRYIQIVEKSKSQKQFFYGWVRRTLNKD